MRSSPGPTLNAGLGPLRRKRSTEVIGAERRSTKAAHHHGRADHAADESGSTRPLAERAWCWACPPSRSPPCGSRWAPRARRARRRRRRSAPARRRPPRAGRRRRGRPEPPAPPAAGRRGRRPGRDRQPERLEQHGERPRPLGVLFGEHPLVPAQLGGAVDVGRLLLGVGGAVSATPSPRLRAAAGAARVRASAAAPASTARREIRSGIAAVREGGRARAARRALSRRISVCRAPSAISSARSVRAGSARTRPIACTWARSAACSSLRAPSRGSPAPADGARAPGRAPAPRRRATCARSRAPSARPSRPPARS